MPAAVSALFAYAGFGSASDGGVALPGAFGQTPGMVAIGGQALQPLRGLKDGYIPLGLT